MLIFGKDDNDDDLELDFDGKKSTPPVTPPPSSSLPTRPEARTPFVSNADRVQTPATEKKTGLPTRIPTSPFGQVPPNTGDKPRVPVNPLTQSKKPVNPLAEENKLTQKPQPPFTRPTAGTPKEAVTPPVAPSVSTYLPPIKTPQPAPEPEAKSEAPSETELYIQMMKEQAQEQAEQERKEEAARKAATAQARIETPVPVPSTPTPPTVSAPVEEEEDKGKKKKKAGFFSAPPKKTGEQKKLSSTQQTRENQYEGERKKILYIRIVAGTVAGIIAIAGFQSIFLPDSGPTKEMVQSAAQEAVGYTGFPTTSGEQFSLDFTKAYFNFDSTTSAERQVSLERFASKDLVSQIDIQILSSSEYEAVKKNDVSYNDYVVSQTISYGPYVVASKNISAEHAVFTVKVGLKSGKVVYLDVPVKYDPANYSMTLAGPPSFTKPIQNKGSVETSEYTMVFEGGDDEQVEEAFQSDLEEYLKAWAVSNSTLVDRYVLDSATDNAKKGLQSSVVFNKLIDLKIESEDEERPSTATSRRVEINVLWEDPSSGLRYPQQYRMLIAKNPEGKWAVYDIENFAVLNK